MFFRMHWRLLLLEIMSAKSKHVLMLRVFAAHSTPPHTYLPTYLPRRCVGASAKPGTRHHPKREVSFWQSFQSPGPCKIFPH